MNFLDLEAEASDTGMIKIMLKEEAENVLQRM